MRPIAIAIAGFALIAAPSSQAQLEMVDHSYTAKLLASGLPAFGSLTGGTDGYLYAVVNLGSGDVGPEDDTIWRIDLATWAVNLQGKIAFTNPATSDLFRIAQAPGGNLTSKLYLVDWVSGAPARIDRVNPDLSDPETMFANTDGDPVDTPTTNIAFSTSLEYLEAGYFGAQGGGQLAVWRFGIAPDIDPFLWADPAGSADIRGIAFGLGGGFGEEMYVAQSTVGGGFDDAPGEIRRLFSDGVGNYASEAVLVSEASGLLEFGSEIAFDPGTLFDGDLLYLQADKQLMRVTPAGAVSTIATGVRNLYFDPAGNLYLLAAGAGGTDLFLVIQTPAVPGLTAALLGVLAALFGVTGGRRLRASSP